MGEQLSVEILKESKENNGGKKGGKGKGGKGKEGKEDRFNFFPGSMRHDGYYEHPGRISNQGPRIDTLRPQAPGFGVLRGTPNLMEMDMAMEMAGMGGYGGLYSPDLSDEDVYLPQYLYDFP